MATTTGNPTNSGESIRAVRSFVMMGLLTMGSLYVLEWRVMAAPHGHPLLYSFAVSWLLTSVIATLSMTILSKLDPALFAPASWERHGEFYERADVRAFRWVLFQSRLSWINSSIHLKPRRSDFERLLRDLNCSEGVHWLTFLVSVGLAIWFFVLGHHDYGYAMLLVRISFDLYPIMLQRWIRGRLWKLRRRAAS